MLYGSTKCAIEYAQRGAIDEWIQLFLRNDGDNVALQTGYWRRRDTISVLS
ncbi:hypothetical protein J43TS9_56020 [Paenibacillus cineris]|nr:hypothetical protein J43TS9_56020 [Paenibacillus cineris]